MNYILMICAILLAVVNSSFLHRFANRGLDNAGDVFLFNGGTQFIWSILLLVFCIFTNTLRFDAVTIAYGVFYAFLLCALQVFKQLAYSDGPVAITTLVGACAFLITTAYTVIFEDDTISILYIIGIITLICSLFLCIDIKQKKSDASNMSLSPKWVLWCSLMLASGGALGIFYRVFGASSASPNMNSMMLFAAVLSAVLLTAISFSANAVTKKPLPKISKTAWKYMLINGFTSCIYIRLNLSLANLLPGTLFFPVSNGGILVLSTLVGVMFFSEKPSKKQLIGIIAGFASIAYIGFVK